MNTLRTGIWQEEAEPDNPFAARIARCHGYDVYGQVLGRATAAWRGSAAIKSSRPPEAVARWAIDGLVELQTGGGKPRAAVDLLVEAARLPFPEKTQRELRVRAAQMAERDLGDNSAAIEMSSRGTKESEKETENEKD